MDEKTARMFADIVGDRMRTELAAQTDAIRRAWLDLPRLANVGREHARNRGVTGHDISVGATETVAAIPAARSLAGREEIFVVVFHATQSLYLAKRRGIADGTDPGRIPLGSGETLQVLTIPWPASEDVWLFGSGAATTGLVIEIARGGR